jgi:hypothetical protein
MKIQLYNKNLECKTISFSEIGPLHEKSTVQQKPGMQDNFFKSIRTSSYKYQLTIQLCNARQFLTV